MYNSNTEKPRQSWSKKKVGSVLKDYRTAMGKTQLEVGKQLKKSQQTVAHWEKGDAYPNVDDFFTLCELYQIDINAVFMGQNDDKKQALNEEEELVHYYRRATAGDKDIIRHILGRYKKKYMEEFSEELAI